MMKTLCLMLVVFAVAFAAVPVRAQSNDIQALVRELERLRTDLVDLQRFVYPGEGEPVTTAIEPGQDGAQLQLSIQNLEERVRHLTGRVEQLEFQQRELVARMDTFVADVEARFQDAPSAALATDTATADTAALDEGTAELMVEPETDTASNAAGAILPPGSEMDQYNFAYSLLRKADYDNAGIAFNEFITVYPESELTSNAYYWLGSTYFVRKMFREAAEAFLRGYQDAPNGPKAAGNLLTLGVALSRLEEFDVACATFKEFESNFPDAPAILLDRASEEASAAGCN
ncbi:MAG: tol-pal system protein YbgF [Rhodospirillales bacterium]|nr:tol-pal system protein YbgF [Rhodospirillales bacterium]